MRLPDRAPLALALLCLTATLGPAHADDPVMTPSDRAKGYLPKSELPDSLKLLPPPPAIGTYPEMLDQQIARYALTLQDSPRFKLAALDADLSFPNAAGTFACAVGVAITKEDTPTLYTLLMRSAADAGAATGAAKDHYRHARPFMIDEKPTCQPEADEALRKNGSYPSGHTSIGWAWAEILAEIASDRADPILTRGRVFGDSRIVCNAHWASDVMEGRMVATATVIKLHTNSEFRADLEKAKQELDAARAKGAPPQRDCAEEMRAMEAPRDASGPLLFLTY